MGKQQDVRIDLLADSDSFGIDVYLTMKDIALSQIRHL